MNTAICIASGPSLKKEDVEYCQGKGTIYAVKECALIAPFADVLYAADHDWWPNNIERWESFSGRKCTVSDKASKQFNLEYFEAKPELDWSYEVGHLATGGNSGFQALNLAVLEGAERVILLGYDYGYQKDNNKHWWDKTHPRTSRYSDYNSWIKRMEKAAPLIPAQVINCTPTTSLTCFSKRDLRHAI